MKLPKEFEDKSSPTIACFGTKLLKTSARYSLRDARLAALNRLAELVSPDHDECLATRATSEDPEDRLEHLDDLSLWKTWDPVSTVMTTSGAPIDDRPCKHCKEEDRQEDMILCDRCEDCYHRDCASKIGGTKIHDGPWFCATCKGALTLEGYADITQDWPLMDHLWSEWLPQDPTEADRIKHLARHYRAHGNEL